MMLEEKNKSEAAEQRAHQRFNTPGVNALLTISPPPPNETISIEGTVLDMSQNGLRIKLQSALPADIPTSKILISIIMPKSGIKVKVRGVIRHISNVSECGINYHEDHDEAELKHLLFECVKIH